MVEEVTKSVVRHVVMAVPVDANERTLVMRRGPNVRSAPNVLSFPSGMHEHGETMEECARRESMEEYGLTLHHMEQAFTYENQPGDGYHWVITVYVAAVDDVTKAVNREPDKHPEMHHVHVSRMLEREFWDGFHPSMKAACMRHRGRILDLCSIVHEV